jgi:hypothetical protein
MFPVVLDSFFPNWLNHCMFQFVCLLEMKLPFSC